LRRSELTYLLRNLATLIDNGLPLAKALSVLARERSLRKHAGLLDALRRKVEGGGSFSAAVAEHPRSFSEVTVCQIRAGERAGGLGAALERIAHQLDESDQVKSQVVRKLAYPALLIVAGCAAVAFMLLFVIPIFDRTYREAGVPLPWITRMLVSLANLAVAYGWILPAAAVLIAAALRISRRSPRAALAMDRRLLQLPIVGDWLRNIVVLQVIEVLGNLLESGFNVVDALETARGAAGNRAIAKSLLDLETAVRRGERFSREIDNMGDLFPPVVGQLIVVGEKTGRLASAAAAIRQHLRRDIDRQTRLLVGVVGPTLTIGLAVAIGMILLAVYLPMFDMIGAMNVQ
jgi:type IV pilus assembly protein PilC